MAPPMEPFARTRPAVHSPPSPTRTPLSFLSLTVQCANRRHTSVTGGTGAGGTSTTLPPDRRRSSTFLSAGFLAAFLATLGPGARDTLGEPWRVRMRSSEDTLSFKGHGFGTFPMDDWRLSMGWGCGQREEHCLYTLHVHTCVGVGIRDGYKGAPLGRWGGGGVAIKAEQMLWLYFHMGALSFEFLEMNCLHSVPQATGGKEVSESETVISLLTSAASAPWRPSHAGTGNASH